MLVSADLLYRLYRLSEKHMEDSKLQLKVCKDRELYSLDSLDFIKFELWPDTQLLNSKVFPPGFHLFLK